MQLTRRTLDTSVTCLNTHARRPAGRPSRSVAEYVADEDLRLAIERRIEIIGGSGESVYHTRFQDAHPRSRGARLSRTERACDMVSPTPPAYFIQPS